MISCYVIGELSSVECLCGYISSFSLTILKGYSLQKPENFDAVYSLRPDIVFVDASLLNANEYWLERIKQLSYVIMVSGDSNQAYEAFEHLAFDYLLKPVPFNRFVKSINKFEHFTQLAYSIQAPQKQHIIDSFFIKADSKGLREVLIKCEAVIYIQAMQNYVVLYMENNQQFSCHNSMKEMEDSLPESSFSRIHKSFIINDAKITSIEGNAVILSNDERNKLLIGSTYRKTFFEKKNQKMIKKQKQLPQIFKYSKLACTLLSFSIIAAEYIDSLQISIDFFS